MRLIDADALKKDWGMANKCEDCPRDARDCQYGIVITRMDICGMLDDAPTVEMPGWVSVQDRLPEYTGWYLTYHHKINLCVVSWFTGDGWEDGDWGAYEDGWVSHWMPLPEDPKEVSGDG